MPWSEKDKQAYIEIVTTMHELGLQCGRDIAKLAEEMHPDALCIVPLYRSCMVVLQDEKLKKAGACKLILYGDPHWLGHEVTKGWLRRKQFHDTIIVRGERSNPRLLIKVGKKFKEMKYV